MNTAVVGLGSNIDPVKNIGQARKLLSQRFKVVAESKFTQTTAIGQPQAPDFLNGAVLLQTNLESDDLKVELKGLERKLGRTPEQSGGAARVIDLDLLIWNGQVIDEDVHQRSFVRESVLELLPSLSL